MRIGVFPAAFASPERTVLAATGSQNPEAPRRSHFPDLDPPGRSHPSHGFRSRSCLKTHTQSKMAAISHRAR